MRPDYQEIKSKFISINQTLKEIALKVEENLFEICEGVEHIDRIACRVKGEKRFWIKL